MGNVFGKVGKRELDLPFWMFVENGGEMMERCMCVQWVDWGKGEGVMCRRCFLMKLRSDFGRPIRCEDRLCLLMTFLRPASLVTHWDGLWGEILGISKYNL